MTTRPGEKTVSYQTPHENVPIDHRLHLLCLNRRVESPVENKSPCVQHLPHLNSKPLYNGHLRGYHLLDLSRKERQWS